MPRKFVLLIDVNNAAFADDSELSSILRKVSRDIEGWDIQDIEPADIRDTNGNTVGKYEIVRSIG